MALSLQGESLFVDLNLMRPGHKAVSLLVTGVGIMVVN